MAKFIFGSTKGMLALNASVNQLAGSELPVLIEGAASVGKDTLAQHIHLISGRSGGFIRILCGPPDSINALDSLLARERLSDLSRSTIYLKHLHALDALGQERLLYELRRSDQGEGLFARARILSSSTVPLEDRVAGQTLLADLYFRLAAWKISIPPLRERKLDVPQIFHALMVAMCGERLIQPAEIPGELQMALGNYSWPGNMRELANFARVYAIAGHPEKLIAELNSRSPLLKETGEPEEDLSLRDQVRRASRALESRIILSALERHRWNRRRAARTLQISYRALLYKIKDFNIPAAETQA